MVAWWFVFLTVIVGFAIISIAKVCLSMCYVYVCVLCRNVSKYVLCMCVCVYMCTLTHLLIFRSIGLPAICHGYQAQTV